MRRTTQAVQVCGALHPAAHRAAGAGWSRRHALQAIGAGLIGLGSRPARAAAASSSPRPRIVALNWALAEILLSLGVVPIAVNDRYAYDRSVASPAMPADVADVGIGGAPSLEALHTLRPARILITPAQDYLHASLAAVAPVESIVLFPPEGQPYRRAAQATLELAEEVGARREADDLLAEVATTIGTARAALAGYRGPPIYLLGLLDHRHARVFGQRSLFQDVLDQLGLRNAWTGSTNDFGFATIGIEALARDPDARIVQIVPIPSAARRVAGSAFWQNLPAVRRGWVTEIGPVWPFGGIATAARFATLLARALPRDAA